MRGRRMGATMRLFLMAALTAGIALSAASGTASAQGFSAFSLIWHSSVVSYCEGRELTHEEAAGTAIGFSKMWQAMRDCQANRTKRAAGQPAAARDGKK